MHSKSWEPPTLSRGTFYEFKSSMSPIRAKHQTGGFDQNTTLLKKAHNYGREKRSRNSIDRCEMSTRKKTELTYLPAFSCAQNHVTVLQSFYRKFRVCECSPIARSACARESDQHGTRSMCLPDMVRRWRGKEWSKLGENSESWWCDVWSYKKSNCI